MVANAPVISDKRVSAWLFKQILSGTGIDCKQLLFSIEGKPFLTGIELRTSWPLWTLIGPGTEVRTYLVGIVKFASMIQFDPKIEATFILVTC